MCNKTTCSFFGLEVDADAGAKAGQNKGARRRFINPVFVLF
jgi:hypothetical protein